MALKRLYFSKFPGEHAAGPLEVFAPLAVRFGQIHLCPPKISNPVRPCLFLAGGVNAWAGVLLNSICIYFNVSIRYDSIVWASQRSGEQFGGGAKLANPQNKSNCYLSSKSNCYLPSKGPGSRLGLGWVWWILCITINKH